jgi:uncharacterized lipoprotein YddW (UPF0748 family)
MRFLLLLFFTLYFSLHTLKAQPKREFRGVWIANVSNVDWPSQKGLSAQQQQQELIQLLDLHQKQGLNAVFLQIRNACDAVYPSNLEPWSEWLTGQQGQNPGYDPLALAIAECRKRGLEIHAWFNPYRAVTDASRASIAPNHVSKTHPSWIKSYGNLRILDPGLPAVRAHVTRVVIDVLRRYDVDGIHFDDYFYPYPQTGLTFNDNDTFATYGRGFSSRADWRRDNVNKLIQMVHDSVAATKPWVKFGVSPFGIWQNKSSSSEGSDTKGFEGYSGIFADSQKWLEEDWVDYVVPQVYWNIGHATANFATLVAWWNNAAFGQHVYVGHGVHKINNDADPRWNNPQQLPDQIKLLRTYDNLQGSVFFSAKWLKANPLGVMDLLKEDLYRLPALVPVMPWKDNKAPNSPTQLTLQQTDAQTIKLEWNNAPTPNSEFDRVRYFVVYRSENNKRYFRAIIPVISEAARVSFVDAALQTGVKYSYAVTAVDRLHNESATTETAATELITATTPANASTSIVVEEKPAESGVLQVFPNPFNQQVSIRYTLPRRMQVQLNVYDARGTRVGVLIDNFQEAGTHTVQFDGQFLSDGVYVARLTANQMQQSAKMVLKR